jgi:hypothetical protein
LVQEAEGLLDDQAEEAGSRAVEAWIVLNAAAVVGVRVDSQKNLVQVRQLRNKIRAMGATLERVGVSLVTDVPESPLSTVAFLVSPKERV